jgi:hypothetical protein
MFDPATLPAAGGRPASTPASAYATDINSEGSLKGQKYGLSVNATGPGLLDGRPSVVSSTLGAGHATFFGFDPFYRAWKEQDERLVLNAAMFPTTETLPATAAKETPAVTPATIADATPAPTQRATVEAEPAVAKADLPKPSPVKTRKVHDVTKDVQIVVSKKYATKLKKAVRAAKLPKAIRKAVSYRTTGKKVKVVTLTIRNGRAVDDFHDRQEWVTSLMKQVKKQKIKVKLAQL